ncbi:MAG: CHAT domain-containing protein [Elainella sp. Prado103]|jgi:CHAT domain-containing protein|nr:CHAT domain-containing protein [Elainella sp. Prado103]
MLGLGVFCGISLLGRGTPARSIAVSPPFSLTPPSSLAIDSEIVRLAVPTLLQQGLAAYEAEQFETAIALWQQALATFQSHGDLSQQALTYHYLALAYQQLSRWSAAEQAIQQGFQQLTPTDPTHQAILAKLLNTQGQLNWHQGQFQTALTAWEQASQAYHAVNDRTGWLISEMNRARALQAQGFSVQAEQALIQVEQGLSQEPDPTLKAIGLRDLGNALRRVGKLKAAQQVLTDSLALTLDQAIDRSTQSTIQLELGNTERSIGNRAIAIGANSAEQHFEAAQTAYQQAVATSSSPLLQLQAQLNQLSLLIDQHQVAAAIDLAHSLSPQFDPLPLTHSRLYAQLNYARSLSQLPQHTSQTASLLATTLQQAQTLSDPAAASYALGQLGALYEQTNQLDVAASLTRQALLQAETIQAIDIRYRWEWQLGRLLERQGDQASAQAAYQAAVESLQSVRNNLLAISADAQFSFRDDVEPVYRGLVELLLTDRDPQTGQPKSENLKQAIQQINALQLVELNNFLGCNLAQRVEINSIATDPTAAKLYPMILQNRLAIVLEMPDQTLHYHEVLQPQSEILAILRQLRQDLSLADRTPEAIAGLQQLHQWIIAPFQFLLTASPRVKTLVFVLDGELRNVPMAALYNGSQYLVENYAVAVAPRLELFQPQPRSARLKVFLGGIGEPQTFADRAFPKIEYLTPELEQIQTIADAPPPLIDQSFTEPNLEQALQAGDFSIIHFKTHGIFSSDPEETFIVAYQALITGRDLGRLIQLGQIGEPSPIELLVLSACSTAQGDNRAVLGLAGMAVQAGARSVVSTLWEAQDLPNTELMIQFYQELGNPQVSRAEALRQAQLHLLSLGYTTPHIWATYVLVGNWL